MNKPKSKKWILFAVVCLLLIIVQFYEFIIYNRWGEEVFFTDKVGDYWDGSDDATGIYTWTIIIIDEEGAIHKKTGSVMLIK